MAGHSKYLLFTDDQTELSSTRATIRRDRNLAKLHLRWGKVLKEELGKLKAEEIVFDKNYDYEKHLYETKLKRIKDKMRGSQSKKLGLGNLSSDSSNENRVLGDGKPPKEQSVLIPGQFSYGKCRKLKWSINEPYQSNLKGIRTAKDEETRLRKFDQKLPGITIFPSLQQSGLNASDYKREKIKTKMKRDIEEGFSHKEKLPKIISLNH